jgi:hypothetical protein
VGNALYGLQNMSSDAQEVRYVLGALAPKIEKQRWLGSKALDSASPAVRSGLPNEVRNHNSYRVSGANVYASVRHLTYACLLACLLAVLEACRPFGYDASAG